MIVKKLLKKEVEKINRIKEIQTWATAFKEASKDKKRLNIIKVWDKLDDGGWD